MPLTDEELEGLLDDLETDRVERKESWTNNVADTVSQALCAFANDLPNHDRPGILFVGARDNGEPSGAAITEQILQSLADLRSNGNILPPPALTVAKRRLKNADMAVVEVLPADSPPVRYRGRVWIRVGPRRGIATAQEERILNEKRRYRDRTFDIHPVPDCPIGELNRTAFESEYLPHAIAPDVLAANQRSYEERLASTGMVASVDDPRPTVVGVLTLGKSPRSWVPSAYVQFLRITGTNWGDAVADEQEIDGTIDQVLRRLDDKLRAHMTVAVDFTSGATTEQRSSPYPIVALQQLMRNAVMHRTYEGTNNPVRVYWFDDRIEVHSPGGPYGTVTADNFGRPGYTDYRNPNLAAVMKVLGFAQRFGFGIAEARRALAANGNPPPEFQVEPAVVLVTIRKAQ